MGIFSKIRGEIEKQCVKPPPIVFAAQTLSSIKNAKRDRTSLGEDFAKNRQQSKTSYSPDIIIETRLSLKICSTERNTFRRGS